MTPAELIEQCIACYKAFQPNKMTIDSHIEVFLASIDCADEGDEVFIKQVVYGCIRFKKLNKINLTALYFKHGTEVSREDYHLYMVFSYLTIMRLEDMGVPVFRKFVFAQDYQKMFVWLSFIFNTQTLNKWMKEEWCRIFDEQFVEDELIARLIRNIPEMSEVIERLRDLASTKEADDVGSEEGQKKKIETTKVEPFNLSKARPRAIPEPFPIYLENPYKKPIPKSVHNADGDGTLKKVEEARKGAKEESLKKLAKAKGPDLEMSKLSGKKDVRKGKYKGALRDEHEKEMEEKTRYIPANPKDPAPALAAANKTAIRLNTAAVLREDALLRKKQEEEAALINKYESELRDDSEYYEWQAKMRELDERKRLEGVEQRRIQMLLTDENAKEARIQNERDNHRFAAEMRAESMAIKALHRAEKEEVLVLKQKLVEDIKESEKNVRPAMDAVVEQKMLMGMELREETRRLEEENKKRMAAEEERRMDIVRQIKALECLPADRAAHFDPTTASEDSKHLLEAMSMAELAERLAIEKDKAATREKEKRNEIVQSKQEREADLVSRVEQIRRIRDIRQQDAKEQRRRQQEKEAHEKAVKWRIRQEAQVELQAKIEERRKIRLDEEEKLKEEMRQIEIKKQFLAAGAAQVEEKKFKELEAGAERKLHDLQARERKEHQKALEAIREDVKNRKRVQKKKVEAKDKFHREYEERFEEDMAAMVDDFGTSHAEKRKTVSITRDFESALQDKKVVADPNKHLTNVRSVSTARSIREAQLTTAESMRSRKLTGGARATSVRDDVTMRAT
eukprot:CAMPEP_0173441814 /NCGR_PEP_ID=MMETSP1357-20121228/24157_1 /TAXON_ID=77926 /ORGANISM="Hemiselmis rufescens, Strain PCC563" /LENGTH=795 /DNA_ID=CAMNT_0014407417 /DNA_START=119 /DNA_END=2502 /DNA_ORIENTATION=+